MEAGSISLEADFFSQPPGLALAIVGPDPVHVHTASVNYMLNDLRERYGPNCISGITGWPIGEKLIHFIYYVYPEYK